MIKTIQDWIEHGRTLHKTIFFYEDNALDLKRFIEMHPGGQKAIMNYLHKDISEIVFSVYPHKRQSTHRILLQYSIGKIPEQQTKRFLRNKLNIEKVAKKQKKTVTFRHHDEKENQQVQDETTSPMKHHKVQQAKITSKNRLESKKTIENNLEKRQSLTYCEGLEEEKPIFKIPILRTKNSINFQ